MDDDDVLAFASFVLVFRLVQICASSTHAQVYLSIRDLCTVRLYSQNTYAVLSYTRSCISICAINFYFIHMEG